ncbi:MAG: 5'/3'-nucleotidase SurE [Phycisphaerales bacterium]|nr:5'/3'-nucleotidase SurE [Phycisphaerales bacterium]
MNILLTNDDGIHAPGIAALHNALNDYSHHDGPLGNIFTVAPAAPQSATSHGITYHTPLMVTNETINNQPALAVEGRPADCTKLALTNLYPEHHSPTARPDLVISGMNAGANCGINVIYSGTVAAAIEAAFIGVPAIAVSLHLDITSEHPTPDWDLAAQAARTTIDSLIQTGLPNQHEVLSINIPATQYLNDDTQTAVCPMNTHALVDQYEQRSTPRGAHYYWSTAHGLEFRSTDSGSDVQQLFERNITITPLTFDLTNHNRLSYWNDRINNT